MRRLLRLLTMLVLVVLVVATAGAGLWLGAVPQSFSPFAAVALDQPPGWFVDFQLAALRRDPGLCRAVLKAPHIEAAPVPDNPLKKQCGWRNAVRVSSLGTARLAVDPLTCEVAAGMALWVANDLQPLAMEILGTSVTAIDDFGTYDCRKMIGNAFWQNRMSEHATANALDIAGFTLGDGRKISVLKHWKGSGPEARFLREAHRSACRYFRVTLSPEFNAAHRDHFHFDRGALWTCK